MASIDKALPRILAHEVKGWPTDASSIAEGMASVKAGSLASPEGGDSWWYSDDPDDPGGATAWGITLATAHRHGIMTKEALRDITPEQVAGIYKADYWRFDGIDDQRVATKIFDTAVNMGVQTAVKLAQRVLVFLGAPADSIDGHFGPWTTLKINAVDPAVMLALLCEVSADRYRDIVIHRPVSAKYLGGWLKRAEAIPCE